MDLSKGIPKLSCIPGVQGMYVIFWWHEIPLGNIKILHTDFPLSPSQVAQRALTPITKVIRNYLAEEDFEALHREIHSDQLQATQRDIDALIKIIHPLEILREKITTEESSFISTTVIICTRDRPESLKRCLNSLSESVIYPQEILVVDNAPKSEATHRIVSDFSGIRYILEPRPGLSIARNTGIFYSSGDIIAFVDDDVTVHPQWLLAVQRAFQNPRVMAMTGLVLPAELETESQFLFETYWSFNRGYSAKTFDKKYFNATKRRGVPAWEIGAGANMAFRRRAFELIGVFDERLGAGASGCSEDSEFWYRVLAEGWHCRYEPLSVVYHYHRKELDSYKQQIFYYMRGHVSALLIQFERYKHWGNLRRLLLYFPRKYIRLILNGIFRGVQERHITVLQEISGCLSGVKFYLLHTHGNNGSYRAGKIFHHNNCHMASSNPGKDDQKSMEMPLVSIIIPCYNQSDFLGEAIKSALHQTYNNIEIIVVDDGSSDRTREVALEFPDIRYIRQRNQGLSAARNTGIGQGRGHYMVFLDADDRLLPSAIESGLNCFRKHENCAFVFGTHTYIKSDGSPYRPAENFKAELNCSLAQLRKEGINGDHYCALLHGNYIGMHASVMYRRDILEFFGGFDTSLGACEDYDLYLRITKEHPICFHDDVVAEYRLHGANMTKNAEMMLRTTLSVLQSQRKKDYIKAYRSGKKFWIKYYGYYLIKQVMTQLCVSGKRIHSLRGIITLLRYAPCCIDMSMLKYAKRIIRKIFNSLFPLSALRTMSNKQAACSYIPPPGHINFGDIRRLAPLSDDSDCKKDDSIDRYYIESFFANNASDIYGNVLEIGREDYALRFGKTEAKKIETLHLYDANSVVRENVINPSNADHVPSDAYDCIIVPQELQAIYEIKDALVTLHRILKPGGVLLATLPGISKKGKDEQSKRRLWSFTTLSARRLFEEVFPVFHLTVESFGNVLASVALMHGLKATDLKPEELVYNDPQYQILITVRAVKP
ncbi:MAG: glycosyltransferase family 2 protein [Candidatus Loosdrechtia sp.]|uniref:glycosyltransferase family 2 protein n=1 Tax=Candidatus Loosdrechtia sp. TaxID=3101272 RepID=UPI003A6AE5D0|nr:MAG: glycosyltransferase [Candidatus Jettenia sp. AMX2]